jgi:DNA-binding beta-propeller fold protein YncE
MKKLLIVVLSTALVCASQALARPPVLKSKGTSQMSVRQKGRVRAPELEGHRGWLNTDRPLTIQGLRGKVVLLDFWTYGCVNCMHIIPDLKRLEAKYANQLVVVGVHSAKFDNEKETENIRRIILRYQIEHPVVNDADFKIWNAYAVRAWPTRVLIDPAGYVVGAVEGEGNYEGLDRAIGELAEEFRARGELNEQPLQLALERAKTGDLPLAFPGKVLADAKTDRLYVSDTNHNRIVVARLDGTVVETVGTGAAGAQDGAFDGATFNHPQGLALDADASSLYVADTQNHLIRRVDLKEKKVSTVAGTGRQARGALGEAGPALTTALASPWDVRLAGEGAARVLYVAMAGPHQVWAYNPKTREVSPFAGTGREARADGPRDEASFAQPSGLATDGRVLYVADSESNVVRAVDLKEGGEVRTLAGGDLFEFGDREGFGDDVRLQHPLGLAYDGETLYVADTYNHKIKQLDPRTRRVTTFAGTGKPGQEDGARPSFYEPGGLSVAGGKLYVADTNNHAVRVVDIRTKETTTLVMQGLRPPASDATAAGDGAGPNATELAAAPQRIAANAAATLVVDVALPAGHHVNANAPNRFVAEVAEGAAHLGLAGVEGVSAAGVEKGVGVGRASVASKKDFRLPVRLNLRALAPGAASVNVRLTLYYCREDDTGVCRVKTLAWRVPVEVSADAGAAREIRLQGKVE